MVLENDLIIHLYSDIKLNEIIPNEAGKNEARNSAGTGK